MFWGDFRAKRHFQNDKKVTSNENTAFFRKKTKSFDSKDFVLAPLTLRFLEKRRRFPTVKTPSFSGRFSICLQGVEIQSFAQPSNTRKISSKFPMTENSRAMKLKELKVVNPQYLWKGWICKECEEDIGPFCEQGERCLKGYSLFFSVLVMETVRNSYLCKCKFQ